MSFILLEAIPFFLVCLAHQVLCFMLLLLRPLVMRPVYPWARDWTVWYLFGASLSWAPDSEPLAIPTEKEPVLFLCNHRGWGDNGIDGCVTNAPYTSRWLVFCAFPFTSIISLLDKGIVFFKRGKTTPEEFNAKCGALFGTHLMWVNGLHGSQLYSTYLTSSPWPMQLGAHTQCWVILRGLATRKISRPSRSRRACCAWPTDARLTSRSSLLVARGRYCRRRSYVFATALASQATPPRCSNRRVRCCKI